MNRIRVWRSWPRARQRYYGGGLIRRGGDRDGRRLVVERRVVVGQKRMEICVRG